VDTHTDDELISIYEAALGPLHNPSSEWLADALVWTRRIVSAPTLERAVSVAAVWTGEPQPQAQQLAESLRAAAGKAPPPPEPVVPAAPWMVHLAEVEGVEQGHGSSAGSRYHPLSAVTEGGILDCCLYIVDPGKRALHLHASDGVEEAVFIVEGEGVLCLGDAKHTVRSGTYCIVPPGPEDAHQLHNTGTTPLRYLCIAASPSSSQPA